MCRRGQPRKRRQKADSNDLTFSQYLRRLINADLEYAVLGRSGGCQLFRVAPQAGAISERVQDLGDIVTLGLGQCKSRGGGLLDFAAAGRKGSGFHNLVRFNRLEILSWSRSSEFFISFFITAGIF